jgi:hypothetical protein
MERLRNLTGAQKDIIAILVLFSLSGLFFANVLLTDQVLVGDTLARYIPWNQYVKQEEQDPVNYEFDTLLAYYPQILVARQTIESGQLPLWNPYCLSGMPAVAAAPWLGLFYPPYALFYVVDTLKALGYVTFLQLGLGGVFMYLYLRSVEVRRLAAVMGATSFGLGGFLLANLTWLPRVSTVIWTPLILLSVENCIVRGKRLYAMLGAVAVAMCILAGNMAAMVYVLLVSGLYSVFRLAWAWKRRGSRFAAEGAGLMGGLLCVGVLLSAVQLVPTLEAAQYASRVQASYEERVEGGRSPIALATVLVPDVFGNPVDRPWGRNEFAQNIPGTYGETSLYLGIVPLFLAVWALARRRDALTAFFGCVALLSLFIFVDTPFFRLLYQLPLFRIGRQLEAKAMWAFAMAALAALGFESLLNRPSHLERKALRQAAVGLLVVASVVLLGFALGGSLFASHEAGDAQSLASSWYRYNTANFLGLGLLLIASAGTVLLWAQGWLKAWVLALVVLSIAMADLMCFGWKLNPARPPDDLYPVMDSVRFLQSDQSLYRTIRGPLSRKVFPPNSLAVYGISDVQGYSPVLIDYYVELLESLEEDMTSARRVYSLRYPASTSSPLLDLLNAKYIITIADPGEEMVSLERSDPNLKLAYDGEVKIYENRDALPRAFFVPTFKVVEDRAAALDVLSSEGFDPSAYVILEKEPGSLASLGAAAPARSEAKIVEYTPNKVIVEVACATNGFVVLSDLYYHGWRAFVDGSEQEVYRADSAFRAVQLEAGEHRIEFVFDPLSFRVGATVSLATLSLLAILTVVLLCRRARE